MTDEKTLAPVCFIDTETLGLDPDYNPIWECAVIRPDGSEWVRQIRRTERERALAHPVALEMTRFEERYDHGTAIEELPFCRQLLDMTDGCHIAGAVISFDEERLRRMLWRHGYAPRWHYHLIDVEALAVGWIAGSRNDGGDLDTMRSDEFDAIARPPWKSDDLSRIVGVDPDRPEFDKHTALGDARWAKAIYEAVMGG